MDPSRIPNNVPSISITEDYPSSRQNIHPLSAIQVEQTSQAYHSSPTYMDSLFSNDMGLQSFEYNKPYSGLSAGLSYESQVDSFELSTLLNDIPPLTGPDITRMSESSLYIYPPSPSPSCNDSQSPLTPASEFSLSDVEYSPASPVTPNDGAPFYGPSRPRSAQPLGHRYTSSDSIAPMELHPPVSNHHRSNSMSSLPRTRVATQAMLEANARRRVHPPQFVCSECGQQFTAQFSLKRHQQSHTGERLHVCSIPGCGQRFFNSSDCKRHEKSKKRHTNLQC